MKQFVIFMIVLLSSRLYSQNPAADFDVIVNYKCGFATTEFVNKSQNADSYLWDSNGTGVFYETFEPRGTNIDIDKSWKVTLIAIGNGTSDTLSKTVNVFNTRVNFHYNFTDTLGFAPLQVDFINESVTRDGDTLTYYWDFMDGEYSEEENPLHTYRLPGTYYIELQGIKNSNCELRASDYLVVKDTAQKDEFDFIISGCQGESGQSPCGNTKNFELRNDSLIIWGAYSGNCGTKKTATIRYKGDTVVIKTWEVGPQATCGCDYCFEIGVPNIQKDSVYVIFDNQLYIARLTDIFDNSVQSNMITVYPNPTMNNLTIDIQGMDNKQFKYELFNLEGLFMQGGDLNSQGIINLDRNKLKEGLYILGISDDSKIRYKKKIYIK
jgi:hypothetical protein